VKTIRKLDIQQSISRLIDFIRIDIWRIRLDDLPFKRSIFIKLLRIILLTLRGFDQDKCLLRASALTFYTLLSIPSVMAMFFGVAKGFGFEKRLQANLISNFPGQEEILTKVITFANSLLEQTKTKGGLIAGIGVAVLFWSVLKVLGHIESSLNSIWEIKESRSWGRKISDYLSVMLLAPICILMSGSLTVFITTQITEITQKVKLLGYVSPLIFLSLNLIPFVLIWVLFTVIYLLMPNTKVNLKAGLLAGIVAGSIYQIFQGIYIGVAKYNAIYGSFAALPLFLMWIQISWWIVLFGAELSFATQNVDTYEYEPDCLKVSPAFKKLLTLQVAHLLIHNFKEGQTPLIDSQISHRLQIPVRLLHQILYELVATGLFNETKTNEDKKFGYQPARDINALTIKQILEAIEHHGIDTIPVARTDELKILSESLEKFSEAIEISPANRLLKDI
jgi:membrane protein